MKTKVVILSLVTAVFIAMVFAFKGCNDAIDNGAFEDETPIVSMEEANEDDGAVSSEKPALGTQADYPRIRRVETYGATGLWDCYHVFIWRQDPDNAWIEMTDGGRLWAHTYNDLGGYAAPGTLIKICITPWLINAFHREDGWETYAYTDYYIYDPAGKRLTFDVTSNWFSEMKIKNVQLKD